MRQIKVTIFSNSALWENNEESYNALLATVMTLFPFTILF